MPARTSFTRKLIQYAAILSALALSSTALAEDADAFAKRKQDEVTAMLNRKASNAEVNKALAQIFDYSTLVQHCWGEHWNDLNDGQKAEVTQLMTTIIENNYSQNLRKALKYDTSVKSAKPEGEYTRVHIRAQDTTNAHAPAINIEYILRREGDSWKVIELIVEQSRMSKNYQRDIHKMMTNKDQGYTYVVQKLRDRANSKK
jgi:ABC-type transporter MlaC component